MIAGFYNTERITRAAERAHALDFVDASHKEVEPHLRISVLNSILECFGPIRAKRKAALVASNAIGFARMGIEDMENVGKSQIDEKVVARMLLTDYYNRFYSPFSKKDNVSACHEHASRPEYQRAFELALLVRKKFFN